MAWQGEAALELLSLGEAADSHEALEATETVEVGRQQFPLAELRSWVPDVEPIKVFAFPQGEAEEERLFDEAKAEEFSRFKKMGLEDWLPGDDQQLVSFMETLARQRRRKLLDCPPLHPPASEEASWQSALVDRRERRFRAAASGLDVQDFESECHARYLLLRELNLAIKEQILPYVDFSNLAASSHSRHLSSVKHVLFAETVGGAQEVKPAGPEGRGRSLTLTRRLALDVIEEGSCDLMGQKMLFAQAAQAGFSADTFRRTGERPFQVDYRNEAGSDAGGLYRDFLTAAAQELMSPHLPLLVKSANSQSASGRDATWVLNPSLHCAPGTPGEKMLRFFGLLLGMCLLRGNILPLNLNQIAWKGLLGDLLGTEDLEAMDSEAALLARTMKNPATYHIDSDLFHEAYPQLRFESTDSSGTTRPLVPGGSGRPVRFEDTGDFAEALLQMRLHEADAQLAVVRAGLLEVVAPGAWALWPWKELERRIAGDRAIDLALLRRKTRYSGGYNESSDTIQHLWAVLEEFEEADRERFLRFVFGQARLPEESSRDWGDGFKVNRETDDQNRLPKGRTCSFVLELPAYQRREVLREKLLMAIRECGTFEFG